MVQGPYGCNQLVRNHYGGDFAVGNSWAGSRQAPQLWAGMRGGGFYGGDSRFTGPYADGPAITYNSSMPLVNQQLICNEPYSGGYDEGYYGCYDRGRRGGYYDSYGYKDRKGYRKHDFKYKYRRSTSDGPCSVM